MSSAIRQPTGKVIANKITSKPQCHSKHRVDNVLPLRDNVSVIIYIRSNTHACPVCAVAPTVRMLLAASVDAQPFHNNNINQICISTYLIWGLYIPDAVGNQVLGRTTSSFLLDCLVTFCFDNGSGGLCRFTALLFAGAETRIMAGQLGRRWIV